VFRWGSTGTTLPYLLRDFLKFLSQLIIFFTRNCCNQQGFLRYLLKLLSNISEIKRSAFVHGTELIMKTVLIIREVHPDIRVPFFVKFHAFRLPKTFFKRHRFQEYSEMLKAVCVEFHQERRQYFNITALWQNPPPVTALEDLYCTFIS
jgi:hypothetical protein